MSKNQNWIFRIQKDFFIFFHFSDICTTVALTLATRMVRGSLCLGWLACSIMTQGSVKLPLQSYVGRSAATWWLLWVSHRYCMVSTNHIAGHHHVSENTINVNKVKKWWISLVHFNHISLNIGVCLACFDTFLIIRYFYCTAHTHLLMILPGIEPTSLWTDLHQRFTSLLSAPTRCQL